MKKIFIVTIIFLSITITNKNLFSQNENSPKGSQLLDIQSKNGDKGILFPKVRLTDIKKYNPPIIGPQKEGMLVYNLTEDESAGLHKGLYIWHTSKKWVKLITSKDITILSETTTMYGGKGDPSNDESLKNASVGSLYISSDRKIIYEKLSESIWKAIINFDPLANVYTVKDGIEISKSDSGKADAIQVKAGLGLQVNKEGLSTKIDDITITRSDDNKLQLANEAPIWNANKIKDSTIDTTGLVNGALLNYNDNKWSYISLGAKSGLSQTIDAVNNKTSIGFKLDGKTIKANKSNQLSLAKDSNIWNASKLYNADIETNNILDKQLLRLKPSGAIGNISLQGKSGIAMDKGDKLNLSPNIDSNTLNIVNKIQLAARKEAPVWDARRIHHINISKAPVADRQILSYNKRNNEITYSQLQAGPGITISANNAIGLLVDGTTLTTNNNKLSALNDSPIWNANKLLNHHISNVDPKTGDILVYDGNIWKPESTSGWEIGGNDIGGADMATKIVGINTKLAPDQHFIIYGGDNNPVLTVDSARNIKFSIGDTPFIDIEGDSLIFNAKNGLSVGVMSDPVSILPESYMLAVNDKDQLFKLYTSGPWAMKTNNINKESYVGFNKGNNSLAIKTNGAEMLNLGNDGSINMQSHDLSIGMRNGATAMSIETIGNKKTDFKLSKLNLAVTKADVNTRGDLTFKVYNDDSNDAKSNFKNIISLARSNSIDMRAGSGGINMKVESLDLNNLNTSPEDMDLIFDPSNKMYNVVRRLRDQKLYIRGSSLKSTAQTDQEEYEMIIRKHMPLLRPLYISKSCIINLQEFPLNNIYFYSAIPNFDLYIPYGTKAKITYYIAHVDTGGDLAYYPFFPPFSVSMEIIKGISTSGKILSNKAFFTTGIVDVPFGSTQTDLIDFGFRQDDAKIAFDLADRRSRNNLRVLLSLKTHANLRYLSIGVTAEMEPYQIP